MKESEKLNFYSLQAGLLSKDNSWGSGVPHPQIVKDSREGHTSFFLLLDLLLILMTVFILNTY